MGKHKKILLIILATLAMASVRAEAQNLDSLWLRLANDSSLVIRPKAPVEDSLVRARRLQDSILQARQDSLLNVKLRADSLLRVRMMQDSILRAQLRADSLRLAREDSIERALTRMDSLIITAYDYQNAYRYKDALECFEAASQISTDEDLKAQLAEAVKHCRYAIRNTSKVPRLSVVARETFSMDDFFLYYPLPDRSWHEVEGAPPMYYPGDEDEIYLSRDASISMVYPMTFGDRMYFSSCTLEGFGGYDLFYCDWDDVLGEWGEPRNLGFPYSSAGDDFLFVESEDGRYNIFASTRGMAEGTDSVQVYVVERGVVLETISNPSPVQLATLEQLSPKQIVKTLETAEQNSRQQSAELNARYKELVGLESELTTQLEQADGDLQLELAARLEQTQAEKKKVEMQILEAGSVRHLLDEEKDQEFAGVEGAYLFTRKNMGAPLKIHYIEN